MVDKYGYSNPHQIPRLEKITLNMGVGAAIGDKKILDLAYRCDDGDHGAKAGDHHRSQVDGEFQASRRNADRLHGHAAAPSNVRVSGPDGLDRLASCS